jgi:hypothetical protein
MNKFIRKWRPKWVSKEGAIDFIASKKMLATAFIGAYSCALHAQRAAGAFQQAATEINGYLKPVQNLLYAIAAIISLVGAFSIYFKMQNGDQDVKKTIMLTIGGCVAFIAGATVLPSIFK